ncbi:hypothetical protein D210916BOD24_21190 [Alteromonas sp. D210916BOD_24]|uniref:DUF3025 domain-containing protein n=1 Tax=Alteromonas sp. D210916BOD_24 TaxID=3157618 RepID=UPI00399C6B41
MQSDTIPFCKPTLLRHASPPVVSILEETGLLDSKAFPTEHDLNDVVARFHHNWNGPIFKGQSTFSDDENRYYETIISEENVVPTREGSWHDLFNALIWLQFPKTKKLLNELHVEDIRQYGVTPRTPRRNRITHFDECGVIIAVEVARDEQTEIPQAPREINDAGVDKSRSFKTCQKHPLAQFLSQLADHQWEEVFVVQRERWWQTVTPFIFGHANLEMMLSPFIGLTGKWLAVTVPVGFHRRDPWQQRKLLDDAIVERIKALDHFNAAPLLKPVPLLGIPGWYEVQSHAFYQNQDYFRPLRPDSKPTVQLPLW